MGGWLSTERLSCLKCNYDLDFNLRQKVNMFHDIRQIMEVNGFNGKWTIQPSAVKNNIHRIQVYFVDMTLSLSSNQSETLTEGP